MEYRRVLLVIALSSLAACDGTGGDAETRSDVGSLSGSSGNSAPTARSHSVRAADGLTKSITLSYTDSDGPGPYTFEVVDKPRHGVLADDNGDATVAYTSTPGFVGEDRFTFRVKDGVATSNVATISLFVQHYPAATWERRTPEQVGLDAALLDQLAKSIGGVGTIVRDGYVVKAWGDQTAKADWASASKPVVNMLLMFAVQEKRIRALEEPVRAWVRAATGGSLRPEDESMTFADLMNMTSGYANVEPPGVAWAYNDYAVNLKNRLTEAIFGEPLDAPLRTRLAPLRLQDGALLTTRGGYGLSTSTRDFARIAWLWLNRGQWRGEQVLAESFFTDYLKTQVPATMPRTTGGDADYLSVGTAGGGPDQTEYGPGFFGMSWWFNDSVGTTGRRPWPNAPRDTIQAHGHWGDEMIVMIPSLNLVVATRGTWGVFAPGDPASGVNSRLRLLSSAAGASP